MNKWPWFLVVFVVVLLDQASKYWANTSLLPYHPENILPMLNFTLAFNTGAAFSFLSGAGDWHRWFFAGFNILMSGVLTIWILKVTTQERLLLLSLSLILGGALGNLIDRFTLGHVVDFIDVFYEGYHWPVFNLADTAICVGAFLMFVDLCKNPSGFKRAA